jgi:hypothetical protein
MPHAIPADASCSLSSGVGALNTIGSPTTVNPIANFITIFGDWRRAGRILVGGNGEHALMLCCNLDCDYRRL